MKEGAILADYEVSKIMWVAIVVALAATIFAIAKPQITTQAEGVFDKIEQVVNKTKTGNEAVDPATVLLYSSTNGGGIQGYSTAAYEDGNLKPGLSVLNIPESVDGKPVVALDFTNANTIGDHMGFKGVTKIIGGSNITKVTALHDVGNDWGDFELDLSKANFTQLDQYAFAGSKSLKKLTLPANFTTFGYAAFDAESGIEEITFTGDGKTGIGGIAFLNNVPKGQLTINAPQAMKAWFDSQMDKLSNIKAINYY